MKKWSGERLQTAAATMTAAQEHRTNYGLSVFFRQKAQTTWLET